MTTNSLDLSSEIEKRITSARDLFTNSQSFDTSRIVKLSLDMNRAIMDGRRVAFVGNGGSAAEAMHIAAEFTGKCVIDHAPLPVLCLNESQSALTAIANDYGVEYMFSRQVEAHLRQGDFLIALSTSGRSKNIANALEVASATGVRSILWMGDFEFGIAGVETWKVPSTYTPRIQEIHLAWGHLVAEAMELLLTRSS
jgi:D-sedoheptulose 7-phosphate isomerase